MHWKGLSGGTEVWQELGEFFTSLKARSVEVQTSVNRLAGWKRNLMPDLSFQVEGAEVVANAASPLLAFKLRLTDANPEQTIHTVALRCQIQLEVTRRKYTRRRPGAPARSVWRAQPLGPDSAKSSVDARQSGRAFVHREQRWSIFPCPALSISM